MTRTIALLLFGSGLAALVYQTAWQRLFRLVFGASTSASAAVLGIFLAGLGAGGLWLGRRAERSERPLYFYGNLEALVAISAALSPLLLDVFSAGYFALGGSRSLGVFGATLLRILIAALVMGPSVVLMGGTLPAAARAAESNDDLARGRLATLYGVNTLGAVLGALLGTFFLFEVFGARVTLWTAALINGLVALLARSLGRATQPIAVNDESGSGDSVERDVGAPARVRLRIAYVAAALVGFAFLGLELIWYRVLSPILGGSAFTFGLVLAVALAGIGLGGYIYSRRDSQRPASLSLLAATLASEASCVALPLFLGDSIAIFAAHLREAASLGFSALVLGWTLIAGIVVFLPALVSGYQLPVVFALIGQGRRSVARDVGRTYAFNTAGSIAGALVTGFLLIPHWGAIHVWSALALALALMGLATWIAASHYEPSDDNLGSVATVGTLVIAVLFASVPGPSAVWRHSAIGAGRAEVPTSGSNALKAWMVERRARVAWEQDGVESSVAMIDPSGVSFAVNGKIDGNVFYDRGTQVMSGLLPALLHSGPKRVFVIGLGTGMTAGWLAQVPGVEHVDVAELEPAILRIAEAAGRANHHVLANPKVNVFLGDGREFMLTSDTKYDLIHSEPSNPYRAGIASLFTEEFYQVVREHLAKDGIFAQWLQAYEVDVHTVRVVLRTLRSVFPHVEGWMTQDSDMLFIASRTPRIYSAAELSRKLTQEPFKSAVQRAWLVEGLEGVFSHLVADARLVASISDAFDPPTNTDDANILEFAFARKVGMGGLSQIDDLVQHIPKRWKLKFPLDRNLDEQRTRELMGRAWMIANGAMPDLPISQEAKQRNKAIENACLGGATQVARYWKNQSEPEPRDLLELYTLAQGSAVQGQGIALNYAEQLDAIGFNPEANLARGRYYAKTEDRKAALAALVTGLGQLRQEALPLCETAAGTISLLGIVAAKDPKDAHRAAQQLLVGPLAIRAGEYLRGRVAQRLGFLSGDAALCVRTLGPQLEAPWWEEEFLRRRHNCLVRAQHPAAADAAADLVDFMAATPGDFLAGIGAPPASPRPTGSEASAVPSATRRRE